MDITKLKKGYIFLGTTLLSVVLMIIALNLICFFMIFLRDAWQTKSKISDELKEQALHAQLVNLNADELKILKKETWDNAWQYEPWVGFRERPRKGKYVNVDQKGFRQTMGAQEGAKHLIFLFGGSTTFGYDVTDDQTIASYLQNKINKKYGDGTFCVRNYGRGYYYSEQEAMLFIQLIKNRERPDVVVFLDGLNDCFGESGKPRYSDVMASLFDQNQIKDKLAAQLVIINDMPVVRAFKWIIKGGIAKKFNPSSHKGVQKNEPFLTDNYLFFQAIIKSVCEMYNIKPYFFIQPVPGYKNNYAVHPFLRGEEARWLHDWVDPKMRSWTDLSKKGSAIDISDLLQQHGKQPFVDNVHYTPEVNEKIASVILDEIKPQLDVLVQSGAKASIPVTKGLKESGSKIKKQN